MKFFSTFIVITGLITGFNGEQTQEQKSLTCQNARDAAYEHQYFSPGTSKLHLITPGSNPLTPAQQTSNKNAKKAVQIFIKYECETDPSIPSVDKGLVTKLGEQIQKLEHPEKDL